MPNQFIILINYVFIVSINCISCYYYHNLHHICFSEELKENSQNQNNKCRIKSFLSYLFSSEQLCIYVILKRNQYTCKYQAHAVFINLQQTKYVCSDANIPFNNEISLHVYRDKINNIITICTDHPVQKFTPPWLLVYCSIFLSISECWHLF